MMTQNLMTLVTAMTPLKPNCSRSASAICRLFENGLILASNLRRFDFKTSSVLLKDLIARIYRAKAIVSSPQGAGLVLDAKDLLLMQAVGVDAQRHAVHADACTGQFG